MQYVTVLLSFKINLILILYFCCVVLCADSKYNFEKSDVTTLRMCLNNADHAPLEFNNIPHLLSYFQYCLKAAKSYRGENKPQILHTLENEVKCALPDVNFAFYSGNIDFKVVNSVYDLLREIKNAEEEEVSDLQKDCRNREGRSIKKHKAVPLVLTGTKTEKEKACTALLKEDKDKNKVKIPSLVLDRQNKPIKLLIPLVTSSECKVKNPKSANILTKFYKITMKCLTLTTTHQTQIFHFNKEFYDWLTNNVLPYLKDDKCYPAFGGVLRIIETMKQNELLKAFDKSKENDAVKQSTDQSTKMDNEGDRFREKIVSSPYFPLIVIPWIIFILIIMAIILWCFLRLTCFDRSRKRALETNSTTEVFYYPIEDTSSVSLELVEDDSSPNISQDSIKGKMKPIKEQELEEPDVEPNVERKVKQKPQKKDTESLSQILYKSNKTDFEESSAEERGEQHDGALDYPAEDDVVVEETTMNHIREPRQRFIGYAKIPTVSPFRKTSK